MIFMPMLPCRIVDLLTHPTRAALRLFRLASRFMRGILIYPADRRIYRSTHRADSAAIRVSRSREPVQRSASEPRSAAFRNDPIKQIAHPARARKGTLGTLQLRMSPPVREPDSYDNFLIF
jgi:hypothetical protein